MSPQDNGQERADYGIGVPGVMRNFVIGGGAGIVLGIVLYLALRPVRRVLATVLLAWGLLGGVFCLVAAGAGVWSSKVGKLRARDRLMIRDGDARWLPLADETFDVVVSSLVLHNIRDAAERERAVREMARVLKPGGHLTVLDVLHTDDYARV